MTLTKAQCETPVGRELIALLTELSADGNVSRQEMSRLWAWQEVDRGIALPALPFLYEVIDHISSDGEITEEELDRLALAIERVLPKEVRATAVLRRTQAREARRMLQRDARRQSLVAARTDRRIARDVARAKAGLLHEADFPVRGAFRSPERREACERLIEGDVVTLEREPDNVHDANAILVLGDGDCELGYVPREAAPTIARLLDAGADAEAVVRRLWETPEGQVVPIVKVKVRQGELDPSIAGVPGRSSVRDRGAVAAKPGTGCATVVWLVALMALAVFGMALRSPV